MFDIAVSANLHFIIVASFISICVFSCNAMAENSLIKHVFCSGFATFLSNKHTGNIACGCGARCLSHVKCICACIALYIYYDCVQVDS